MTPRQADLAFVLAELEGVLEVHALEGPGELDFAVVVERPLHVVAAHYAMLRVLSHEECGRVHFAFGQLRGPLRSRARRLELTAAEREEARARVPLSSPALEQEPAPHRRERKAGPRTGPFGALVVDGDVEVHRAVRDALGEGAEVQIHRDPEGAVEAFLRIDFDLCLCDVRLGFGGRGFLTRIARELPDRAGEIVLVAAEGERELLDASLTEISAPNIYLVKPLDPVLLRNVLRGVPVVPPIPPSEPVALPRPLRSVLVIDDGSPIGSTSEVRVVMADEPWGAIDSLASDRFDLVLCSSELRTAGGAPLYRFLWSARPDLKRRFALIVPRGALANPGERRALERPITADKIRELLERLSPSV